jgi:hypothetical protein
MLKAGIDLTALVSGLAGAGAFAAIAQIVGNYLSRKTSLDTTNVDDRAKLTKDLQEQVERDREEHQEFRVEVRKLQRETEATVRLLQQTEERRFRLLSRVEAELRSLNLHLTFHSEALQQEVLNRPMLVRQAETIKGTVERMASAIEAENLSAPQAKREGPE